MNKTIYFITGPTGIGKSDFAINLSKKLNGELINADSMQIYKELEIISARPRGSDIKKVQHHLYGYVSGKERFNVDKWCKDAANKVHYLLKKKSSPIFVGGTGLYIDTLINGITSIPNIPEYIKVESNNLYNKIGSEKFLKLVRELDYDSTKNILQNDTQRLKRIWEVFRYTNKKFSYWKKNSNKKFLNIENYKIILFLPDREKNYQRVNQRVLKMIDNGAINEIKELLKLNYKKDLPIMRAHGVPEISSYLEKEITLEECIARIQLVTRHYVKRQNTWWRSSKLQIFKKINEFPDEFEPKLTKLALF